MSLRTSGIHTSEFWLSLAAIVAATVALVAGSIDADKWILVITGATGAYNVSRGLAKVGPSGNARTETLTITEPDPGP